MELGTARASASSAAFPQFLLQPPPPSIIRRDALHLLPRQALPPPPRPPPPHPRPRDPLHAPLFHHLAMPRVLQRSGSNSLSALLRAEPPDAAPDAKRDDSPHGRPTRRTNCLRLPLGSAGCRVCACDEMDSAAAASRRRPMEEAEGDDAAVQCFSWKKGAALTAAHRSPGAGVDAAEAASLSVLPDDVMEMVLCRLPLASLLASRCVCRRWRDLTIAPQFLRMRREEGPSRTPWLFLFGVEGNAGWGGAPSPAVHALDVATQRWCRVEADGLKGRYLFSVAGVGDELYVVGGRSGGSDCGKVKTHKGVLVFSPLTGSWRKAAPMRTARSRPVLGVFEMSSSCSILHARTEKHVRRAKPRFRGTSTVYEDPHRLSLRRLRLRDMLNDDTDAIAFTSSHDEPAGQDEEGGQLRLAIVAVGGRGQWDEPLVSGEIYDPSIDKWVEIAGFPADVGLACSGVVCGRMFYVYCESDTVVGYQLDRGSWVVIETSRPPPRLRDYAPILGCCASRLFMLCVSWCDRHGPVDRREKVVRKLFELDLSSLQWTEASEHPDAPMDPNAAIAVSQDTIFAVEMFRIFGKVLDFVTSCQISETEQKWSRIARKNAAMEADSMSCRLKSMAVLYL